MLRNVARGFLGGGRHSDQKSLPVLVAALCSQLASWLSGKESA